MSPDELLHAPWFVLVDDVVGGWAVATADVERVSQLDRNDDAAVVVGWWLDESIAGHVCAAHAGTLDPRRGPGGTVTPMRDLPPGWGTSHRDDHAG